MANKKLNTYFIEDSVFFVNDFYKFIEELTSDDKVRLKIYVDSNILKIIENYKKTEMIKEAYYVEAFYNMLSDKQVLDFIDTKGYLDATEVLKLSKEKEIKIITNKETVFQTLKGLPKAKYYKFEEGKLLEWVDAQIKKTEAFYLENDIYINKVDTEKIKYVFSPKYGYLKLDRNDVKSGGEGSCYPTYKNFYCKIYNYKHITYTNLKKLQAMLDMDIFNPFIVWPKDILYYNDDFVGYVMEQVRGAKSLTELKDDGFDKYQKPSERARICLNILKNIEYLHQKGILIGDLKDDNILVKNPDTVYIIDCGSFQINDYPCDVFTKGWTDKKYKGKELDQNLRVIDDEYYPINRLIFEIMVLKNPHYSKDNPEIDYEDTKTFEFPLNVNSIDNVNSPLYLKAWKMLSIGKALEYFYYYFKNRRITYIADWINEFNLLVKEFEKYGM